MNFIDRMCEFYNISLNQLAKAGGVAPSTVATWKRDNRNIDDVPFKVIKRWADYFNTLPDWIVAMFN